MKYDKIVKQILKKFYKYVINLEIMI